MPEAKQTPEEPQELPLHLQEAERREQGTSQGPEPPSLDWATFKRVITGEIGEIRTTEELANELIAREFTS